MNTIPSYVFHESRVLRGTRLIGIDLSEWCQYVYDERAIIEKVMSVLYNHSSRIAFGSFRYTVKSVLVKPELKYEDFNPLTPYGKIETTKETMLELYRDQLLWIDCGLYYQGNQEYVSEMIADRVRRVVRSSVNVVFVENTVDIKRIITDLDELMLLDVIKNGEIRHREEYVSAYAGTSNYTAV